MMKIVTIAAAQTHEYQDDFEGALSCLVEFSRQAEIRGAKLLCFPEAFLQGYVTEETSARKIAFDIASARFQHILQLFSKTTPVIVVGFIEVSDGKLFNSAAVIEGGKMIGCYRKSFLLPKEAAFCAGEEMPVFSVGALKFGINICYDTNFPASARRVADGGATVILCPANNMMRRERAETFRDVHNAVRGKRCQETGLWLLSADVTGEGNGRVSLGPTALLNPDGQVIAQLPFGKPGLLVVDVPIVV
ncbi:carbon-nitrogen hydrolase family protein [Agrobacterium sp. rho-13.3]|uniref:carbon-nitrogen hydrolase family protein n=1 Tax=Agrobacterium sp. rho-13.3 TaxID=3072980 RepID=UPI0039B74E93